MKQSMTPKYRRILLKLSGETFGGSKGFGFDYTTDYFTKLTYEITPQHKLTLSYWNVDAHRKGFKIYSGADDHPAGYAPYLYWDDGQNEIFRNTQRTAFEFNHTVNNKSFYTVRLSDFIQDQFIGVRALYLSISGRFIKCSGYF